MKTNNDQLTATDFAEMQRTINIVTAKLERANSYAEDMKSSRLLVMRDAKAVLSAFLSNLDEIE